VGGLLKSLCNKGRSSPKIDAVFKEYNTILNNPRLAFLAIKNVSLKLHYKGVLYVVGEELLYPSRLAN
jgi:hypothetical protein